MLIAIESASFNCLLTTELGTKSLNLTCINILYDVMLAPRVGKAVQKARSNGHVITITVQTQALQLCLRLNIKSEYCTSWVNDFNECILSAVGHPTGRVSPTYSG
jgi:hypothetical protein